MLMAQEPFVSAELDYRLSRATDSFEHDTAPRHTPRRRTLHLPRPLLRPLHLA